MPTLRPAASHHAPRPVSSTLASESRTKLEATRSGASGVTIMVPTAAISVTFSRTAEVAATLAPRAVMFYAPFREGVVTGARLVAFGLRACGPDLWRIALMAVAGGLLALLAPVLTGLIFQTLVPQAERAQLMLVGTALGIGAVSAAASRC